MRMLPILTEHHGKEEPQTQSSSMHIIPLSFITLFSIMHILFWIKEVVKVEGVLIEWLGMSYFIPSHSIRE